MTSKAEETAASSIHSEPIRVQLGRLSRILDRRSVIDPEEECGSRLEYFANSRTPLQDKSFVCDRKMIRESLLSQ